MNELIVNTLWIYGLAAVVSLVIAAIIKLIVVLMGRATPPAVTAPAPVLRPVAAFADADARRVAAISAAVYACIGEHRIVHIEHGRRGADWAAGGRQAHHGSHVTPPRQTKR